MLRAGIDIGTNTILLLIADVENGRVLQVVRDEVRVVRLGQGVDKYKNFQPEALDRARQCFQEYAEILKEYPRIPLKAVATSGSRDAQNSKEFFLEIQKTYGIPVEIISGDEEALMSFCGALSGETADPSSLAVLDIGGGSTEIVGLDSAVMGEKLSAKDLFKFSFDLGCVRMTERFLKSDPPTKQEVSELRSYVKGILETKKELFQKVRGRTLIGVAGTVTYLAASALGLKKFDPDQVHGALLTKEALQSLIEKFQSCSAAERLGVGGMDKGRADVILGGAIILQEVMYLAALKSIRASVRGLRFGATI